MSGTILILIGVGALLAAWSSSTKPPVQLLCAIGGATFLLTGLVRTLYGVDDLRNIDARNVTAIEILPSPDSETYPSLVKQELVIDGRGRIDQVVQALAMAKEWSPNHPKTQWACLLKLRSTKGDRICVVSATTNNGVLVSVNSDEEQGWRLATYRQDELGPLLEHLAGSR